MRRSKVLEKLRADKPALLTSITLGPSTLAVEIAGRTGLDGVWIDMEHRPLSQREVAEMINAARIVDTDAMVRIRKGEGYTSFFRPFEDGAAGIMVPHITSREEAEWVVLNAKYPPLGRRGCDTFMPDADVGFSDPLAYLEHANRETFVVAQIEDAEALDHLDEIAAVPGLDVLFIGPADLSISLGVPFQMDSLRYREAVQAIRKAAERHGKWWGLVVGDVASAVPYVQQGARFLCVGGDLFFLRTACLSLRKDFDEAVTAIAQISPL
jgi:4-hydroxy-2-oxoheptanedioate aldolase